jgi:signal transduction histidine kinase
MDVQKTPERPITTAAERLKAYKKLVLELWSERARKELPAARAQNKFALYNQIPDFLDEIAEAIAKNSSDSRACGDRGEVCREHGQQRAGLAFYSIEQVILEYGFLRQVIFQVLEKEAPLSIRERECILDSLNMGISIAAAEYSKVQDSLREQFVAVLSHDLRNPLSAIKTSAQMMLRDPGKVEKVQTLGARIVDSVNRADNMIRDLLDTFQLRVGQRLPIKAELCDLKTVTLQSLEELSTIHGDRFVLDSPEGEIAGYWSGEGLRRCIENLANNAVKYGDAREKISIRLQSFKDSIEIEVNNKGVPIVSDDQAALFTAYQRGPLANTGGKAGWGLGLALVKGMVDAHGGRVSVTGNEAEGTTFKITLPRDARSLERPN